MRRNELIAVCIVVMAGVFGCSTMRALSILQGGTQAATGQAEETVPFHTMGNILLVEGRVSNVTEPLLLIMDTGAFTCVSSEVAARAGFQPSTTVSAKGPGGEKVKTGIVELGRMSIGKASVDDLGALAMDMASVERYLGTKVDGIIGNNFLRQFTVGLNHEEGVVTFYRERPSKEIPGLLGSVPFRQNIRYGFAPEVALTLNETRCRGILDNGLNAFVAVPRSMCSKLGPGTEYAGEGTCMQSLTEPIRDCGLVVLDSVNLGSIRLHSVPAIVMECRDVMIGGKLLELFNLLIDYEEGSISFAANRSVGLPMRICHTGVIVGVGDDSEKIVMGKWDIPSASAVAPGDTIESINGVWSGKMSGMAMDEVLTSCGDTLTAVVRSVDSGRGETELVPMEIAELTVTE